jgi:hypothetical protein
LCIAGLLAEQSLDYMPGFPDDLAYPEVVLEEV